MNEISNEVSFHFLRREENGKVSFKEICDYWNAYDGHRFLFIVMNYFSNNTIWDLIIHDEHEDVLLYENRDATSKAKYKYMKNGVCHCLIDISV